MAKWKIDPDHAVGEFTVRHMMVTPVHGQLNKVSGLVHFDPADPASASVSRNRCGRYLHRSGSQR